MKISKTIIMTFGMVLIGLHTFAQDTITDMLQAQYQECLDQGRNMLACSRNFYQKMDSLLNVRYRKLRLSCDPVQAGNLKDEQVKWLAKRDKYFKSTEAAFKKKNPKASPYGSSFGTQDDAMFMFDKNASFLKTRAVELAGRSPGSYAAGSYHQM